MNPEKFPFDVDVFYNAVIHSNWQFEDALSLMRLLLGLDLPQDIQKEMLKYIKENDLDKEIEQIKLTRTLRSIYEDKKESI